jgi:hypothetical protein
MMEAVCSPETVVSTYRARSQCESASRCEPLRSLVGQDKSGRPLSRVTHVADNDSVHTPTYAGVTQNSAFSECILILGSISGTRTVAGTFPIAPLRQVHDRSQLDSNPSPLLHPATTPSPILLRPLSLKDINPDGGNCSDFRSAKIFLLYAANARKPKPHIKFTRENQHTKIIGVQGKP